jgi:hypothetical protein
MIAKRQTSVNIISCAAFPFKQYRPKKKKRKDRAKVENILEILYNLPMENIHERDASFVKAARVRREQLEQLTASMTDEQQELLDAYLDTRSKFEDMIDFDRFRFAFHFGAQLMAELMRGKGAELLDRAGT